MRIVFDNALDGPAYPGPLENGSAFGGQAWVGPLGLLGILETQLGLGGKPTGPSKRTTALNESLKNKAGFWRPSYEKDPLGTARRLLHDRDLLTEWGWQNQGVSPRLCDLAMATEYCLPGIPDRLRTITAALAAHHVDIEGVATATPIDHLPTRWRQLFAALQAQGTTVEKRQFTPANATGDLFGARAPNFVPAGDGRLSLVRRFGVLDLADEVAAALAAQESLEGVVVIGADAVLNNALARHGLPTTDVETGTASANLLPLIIETAFHPMEMSDLHALLVMDPGPVPRAVAWHLSMALTNVPGRTTQTFADALKKGLESVAEDRRESTAQRIDALVMPVPGGNDVLEVAVLRKRMDVLRQWAQRRATYVPSLMAVFHQVGDFDWALQATGAATLSRFELRRLCEDFRGGTHPRHIARAGIFHVRHPGAILAPARHIVWWNFSRTTAPAPQRLFLTRVETEGLQAKGITPPNSALGMQIAALAWRRPLLAAENALWLACPENDEAGERNHPHPLWDELTAGLKEFNDQGKLCRAEVLYPLPAKRTASVLRDTIEIQQEITIPIALSTREVESPSSIEKLIGCSLSWALTYRGRLGSGLSAEPLSPSPLLFGSVVHALMDKVLTEAGQDAEFAARLAGELFDEWIADKYEPLAQAHHEVDRATTRRIAIASARELARLAGIHKATIVGTELEGTVELGGQRIRGHMDLVWESPHTVLDLKWGKSTYSRKLFTGTQVQLAAYAAMRAGGGVFPETAYFSLVTQQILAEPDGHMANDGVVPGDTPTRAVWDALKPSLLRRRKELADGVLHAPWTEDDKYEEGPSKEGLKVAPPCGYCAFGELCGRKGGN